MIKPKVRPMAKAKSKTDGIKVKNISTKIIALPKGYLHPGDRATVPAEMYSTLHQYLEKV